MEKEVSISRDWILILAEYQKGRNMQNFKFSLSAAKLEQIRRRSENFYISRVSLWKKQNIASFSSF